MGRPTKLTPEVQQKVVEALGAGHYMTTAATIAGVSERSVFRWIEAGEKEDADPLYADFWLATKDASAKAEHSALSLIQADPDWKAQAWFLERRFPSRYARREPDYDLKTKQLMADLAKSEVEIDTLKAKLDLLKQGHDVDAQVINVVIPAALAREGE